MEITAYEAKARWAYAELNSTRWGGSISAAPPTIVAMARDGVPFEKVPSSSYSALINWLLDGRASDFVANVDRSEHYVLQAISKMQLLALWAISSFNPTKAGGIFPYTEFYHERMKRGRNDPRDAIESIPRSASCSCGPRKRGRSSRPGGRRTCLSPLSPDLVHQIVTAENQRRGVIPAEP